MKEEIWRDIEKYDWGYQISNYGRIRSKRKILKTRINYLGYECIRLGSTKRKNKRSLVIHRLVAQAFIPNPNSFKEVNHKDLVKTNNHVDNLEWSSRVDNMRHAWDNGACKSKKGEDHFKAKLRESDVIKIRSLYNTTLNRPSIKSLAEKFGVCEATAREIIIRKIWKHI